MKLFRLLQLRLGRPANKGRAEENIFSEMPDNTEGGTDSPCEIVQDDSIMLSLPMLSISLTRKIGIDVPHEVSVFVPRAEIRFKEQETEFIYNSITIVHAPRHPIADEQPKGNINSPVRMQSSTPENNRRKHGPPNINMGSSKKIRK